MRHASLFAGIGGFDLALEAAGVETAWQVELADFPTEVLVAHWPRVERLRDVRDVDAGAPRVDVVSAGFPCQPVSQAGRRRAQQDDRWLWPEVARVVGLLEPRFVLLENVRGLYQRGLADVLADLARLDYDAEYDLVSAWAVGAPHLRNRVFIAAWRQGEQVGRVFRHAPERQPWLGEIDALPRLLSKVPRRGDRLTALGNAIVPAQAAYVARSLVSALDAGPVEPGSLFGFAPDAAGKFPRTGRMRDGTVFDLGSRIPEPPANRRGTWPTPKASPSGPDFARASRDGSGGDDLATFVARVDRGLKLGRATARTDEQTSNPGTTLLDAAIETEAPDLAPDGKLDRGRKLGTGLSPRWVEWLMGFPAGWTDV